MNRREEEHTSPRAQDMNRIPSGLSHPHSCYFSCPPYECVGGHTLSSGGRGSASRAELTQHVPWGGPTPSDGTSSGLEREGLDEVQGGASRR